MDLIDEKTLVVLTDVHNPMGSLISRLFDRNSKAKSPTKVVVFDHHMKNTKESEITPIFMPLYNIRNVRPNTSGRHYKGTKKSG